MPWVREARRRLPRNLRARIECFRFFFEPGAEVFPLLWGQPGLQPFDAELRGLQKVLAHIVTRSFAAWVKNDCLRSKTYAECGVRDGIGRRLCSMRDAFPSSR